MRLIKFKKLILIMVCVFNIIGCDAIYRALDKQGAEEKDLIGEVIPFEVNPTVEEIQNLLKIYGYSVGQPDGVLGRRTRDAIENFQRDSSLELTRFADAQTWQKLKEFRDNGFITENQVNIVKVQTMLDKAGYNVGKIDGKPGAKTNAAILKFQKSHGLKADGKIGYKTLSALRNYDTEPQTPR